MTPSFAMASTSAEARSDRPAVKRFLKFAAAGAGGFVLQIAVVGALAERASGLHYLAATAIGVEAAILTNFLWHDRWTWRDRPAPTARDRWLRLAAFQCRDRHRRRSSGAC